MTMHCLSNLYTIKITNQLVFAEQTLLAQACLHSDLCPSSIPLVSYNLTFQSAWLHKLYTCWQDLAFKLWNGQPDLSIGNSYCYLTRLVDHSILTKHQSVASIVYIYIATVFCLTTLYKLTHSHAGWPHKSSSCIWHQIRMQVWLLACGWLWRFILCQIDSTKHHLGLGLAAAPSTPPPLPHKEQTAWCQPLL